MIIPVVIAALALGRSFDFQKMTTSSFFIYDSKSISQNMKSIPMTYTSARYRIVESSADAQDFLNIGGEITLKALRGLAVLQGHGDYIVQKVKRERTIELLITVYHETVTETFPSYAKLRTEWKSRNPRDVGTHYIRSITYGGQLLISYKMIALKSEDMSTLKAAVFGRINSYGDLDAEVAGDLDLLEQEIGSKFNLEIQAYATTAGSLKTPTSLKDVLELVKAYPESVNKLNNGKGSPLKLELVPLSTLDSRYKEHKSNAAMDSILNDALIKYDDMNAAVTEFKSWEGKILWNDDQQIKIDAFNRRLKKAYQAMIHAISNMDLSEEINLHHFDEAFEAYGSGKDNIPNKYTRELIKLQHEVESKPFLWFPYTKSVTHYVHWGSVNCTLPSSDPIYKGYAASSPEGFGNGGNLQCIDVEPNLEEKELSNNTVVSYISGLTYQTPQFNKGFVYCAFCRLENATSVFTIVGRNSCPQEMKLEYTGFLTTNIKAISEMICLDGDPDDNRVDLRAKEDIDAGTLAPVWIECPKCDEDEKNKYVPCAVCSR